MSLTKAVVLLVALATIAKSSPTYDSVSGSDGGFSLSNLAGLFGFKNGDIGVDDVKSENIDVQVLKDLISQTIDLQDPSNYSVPATEDVASKLIERLNISGADKAELLKSLKAPVISKPTFVSGVRNGPVSRFIKSLILDCVKEIIKTIKKEEETPTVVPKDETEKSRQIIEKLKEEFNSKIEETYKPLLEALDKSNGPDVTEEKQKVIKLIEDAKLKIDSLVDFYNGTSKNFDEQLKTQKEIVNEHVKNFTDAVIQSNCISVRKSKTAFQKCLEPIYCEFTKNLTKNIDKIEELKKLVGLLGEEAVEYVTKAVEKELNKAKENVQKEIEKLNEVKPNPEAENAEYLKKQSEDASKEIEKLLTGPVVENKNNLNQKKEDVQKIVVSADVNATQVPERDAINTYLNNTVTPNVQVDNYVEEKTNVINNLANKVVEEINSKQKEVQSIEEKIKTVTDEYNQENVNEKCKNDSAFKACVDSAYKDLKDKLQILIDELTNVNKVPVDVNKLQEQTTSVLNEATEKAKDEAQRLKEEAEEKEKYVKDTKNNSDEKIQTEVVPLVNTAINTVNELSTKYDDILEILKKNLTTIITQNADDPNAPLTDDDKLLIEKYVEQINNKIDEFKNQLKDEENKVKSLDDDLKKTALTNDGQYLKNQCWNEYDVVITFKQCIDANIAPLNEKTNSVVTNVNDIIEKLKQNSVNVNVDINNVIKEILDKTDAEYAMQKKARDENTPTASAERVSECLETINKKVNDEISPLIESLFAVPVDLKENSSKQVTQAVATVNKVFQTWVDALDFSIILNSKKTATYNQQKTSINSLIQESLSKINSNVQLNLDSFTDIQLKLQQIDEKYLNSLADFDGEKLNQACEAVYSSKKNYTQCIDEQCSKFGITLNKFVRELDEASNEVNILFLEAQNNITKTIEEEEKAAYEKAKKEAMALFNENNVTQATVQNLALEELKRFNITPYIQYVKDINYRAGELAKRTVNMNYTGQSTLTRASLQMNLHVYAASQICPKVSVKNETNYGAWLIEESRKRVTPLFPDTAAYVSEQYNIANQMNASLYAQMELLQTNNIEKVCGSKKNDKYEFFVCVKGLVKDFENYFVPASKNAKVNADNASNVLKGNTLLLNEWRDVDIANEMAILREKLGPIPESIYSGACNATKDKAIDFALLTINSRYSRYSKALPEGEQNVTATAKAILGKKFDNIVNIEDKLNGSVKFIRDAIIAAEKKNASYVTPTLRAEPSRSFGVGVGKFKAFIGEMYQNATNAINESTALRVEAETLYANLNRSSLDKTCYNASSPVPITALIVCNNGLSVNFEVELRKIQAKLDETRAMLDNINNTSGKQVLEEYANKLANDLLLYSAQYSIKIYLDNGLAIPDDLKPYNKSGCVVSVNGVIGAGCIIWS